MPDQECCYPKNIAQVSKNHCIVSKKAFTYVISVKNVVDAWRNGTIKQPNLKESFRPWGEFPIGCKLG